MVHIFVGEKKNKFSDTVIQKKRWTNYLDVKRNDRF